MYKFGNTKINTWNLIYSN